MSVGNRGLGTRGWWGFGLLVLPMVVLAMDLTVLFFAMPTVSAELRPSATQALWIVHAYGFTIAGFLVTMGRLSDRVGPRRLLLGGSAAFGVLSVAAAFAPNAETLIVARGLLGVAGATLMPSLFTLVRAMFADDRRRRFAIALLFSAFSVGGALGPLVGGWMLAHFWWGSVFLLGVPPVVLLLAAGRALLPDPRPGGTAPLDAPSVALSVAGMLALVYGLQELAAGESAPEGVAFAAAGCAALLLFVRRQRKLRDPLFDLALLADRRVSASLTALLLSGIAIVGVFYLFTQYLQWVEGLSPLRAGFWTLPYVVVNVGGALLGPGLAGRFRPAAVVAGGLGVAAFGGVLVAVAAGVAAPLPVLVAALALVGLGQGAAFALVSDLIIASAPADRAGSAAAAQEVGGELGAALGLAAGGAISVLVYRRSLDGAGLPADAEHAAKSGVPDGLAAAAQAGEAGHALLTAVHNAITHGLQTYAALGVLLVTASALLVALHRPHPN
ncbi:MFS transporter [Actinocorallia sp. A-T 12471]|uniref:MFS transporter n=1 Tax=Actinocorallia sp. A-T 12471 TaxID=3089813 RepID=UPI0029D1EAE1|nr:MFS transporter [Actinocorallia sp. A-T 12471]MDX6740129.1 MFS transporter [Actinocorallia sp. A-T 12471]